MDLAVSCEIDNQVVFLVGFGDGVFFRAQNSVIKRGSGSFAVGDVNRDGKLDIGFSSERLGISSLYFNVTPTP